MICCNCLKESPTQFAFFELFTIRNKPPFQLCSSCQKKFTEIPQPRCPGCARSQTTKEICSDCLKWQTVYSQKVPHEAFFMYDADFSEWMEQFKFKGAYHYRFALTEMLAGKITIPKNHLLVPIPLSRQRYESRGFNQVTAVLESAKFAYTPLLNRKVDFTAQSFQKKKERMNLPQVFEVNEKFANSSQKIILIDDVYTTGTTLVRAQQACEGQNLKVVKTLSFAR